MGDIEQPLAEAPACKVEPPKKRRGVVAAIAYACLLSTIAGFGAGRSWDFIDAVIAAQQRFLAARAQYVHLVLAVRAQFADAVRENIAHPQPIPGLPHATLYPPIAERLGQEGDVTLKVLVLPNGQVGDAAIVQSSGHIQLDAAALIGVGGWVYIPAIRDHRPVGSWILVKVRFRMVHPAG